MGIVLLVPILRPEQNKEINEVVSGKAITQCWIFIFRLVMAVFCMIILISVFAGIMKFFYCKFPYFFYVFGTFCSAFALGCIGLFTTALVNNTVVGYLVSITYLLLDMFTKNRYLGVFTLSSMQLKNYQNKYWLLVLGIILVTGTMFVRKLKLLR
ncbi:hypothetical protein CLORY_30850 [Clostridium oryzae]|uniref:Uncharacterized protein n=1 Tax=Clostridium oryzae TaxID=1450648 RepID=A0A1V4IIN6_9CLOT|nr:hypothetical protein CLORY_30850 [Clostridium oryzae]